MIPPGVDVQAASAPPPIAATMIANLRRANQPFRAIFDLPTSIGADTSFVRFFMLSNCPP
jgi:hypothetical protein